MEENNRSGKVQSVERAVSILKCFEGNKELGITQISKMTGLNKSTAFGLVNTLESCGFLEHEAVTGKYKLGLEIFRLGLMVDVDLRAIAAPFLNKLSAMYQETVNLVVLDNDSVIYLEKLESPHAMRISTTVGVRLPLYCTAVGKAILASMDDDRLQIALSNTKFVPYTDKTVRSKRDLEKQLSVIRSRGYAVDDEELEYGLFCIGVSIQDTAGMPIAAISVSGPKSRMTEEILSDAAQTLRLYAREIERGLSGVVSAEKISKIR